MNLIFSVSSGKGKFVNEGFCRWDKATDRLGSHERTKEHVGNNGRWEQSPFYSNQNTAINNQLAPKRRDVMEDHREYFRILVTNIRYFCLQCLPYRHESEQDEEAVNTGNWAEHHEHHCRISEAQTGGGQSLFQPCGLCQQGHFQ